MDFDAPTAVPTFVSNNLFSQSAPTSPLFGFVVSGSPVRTDFRQVDATKFTCCLTCPGDIQGTLSSASEVALFLLQPLPADHGVLCYWQLSCNGQTTEFELFGALTPDKPSRIFYTGWGEHEQVVASASQQLTLTIGLSLEPMSNISNLNQDAKQSARIHVAQKIAMDLFQFMQSFDTGAGGPGNMVVPNNIFDRWMKRFENRMRRNPNFFLKSQNDA